LSIAKGNKDYNLWVLLQKDKLQEENSKGNTPLMQACENEDEKTIFAFINHGDDFHYKNNKGLSALNILIGKSELSKLLNSLKEKILLEDELKNEDRLSVGL